MLASFSISPVGVGEALSKHVAEIVDMIDKSGLKYKLGAMQTTVEGDDAEVMALILQCHRHMRAKAKRVARLMVAVGDSYWDYVKYWSESPIGIETATWGSIKALYR